MTPPVFLMTLQNADCKRSAPDQCNAVRFQAIQMNGLKKLHGADWQAAFLLRFQVWTRPVRYKGLPKPGNVNSETNKRTKASTGPIVFTEGHTYLIPEKDDDISAEA